MVVGLIHLELGQAYLRGEAPLPVDHVKARFHLELAKQAEIHKTTDAAEDFDGFRNKLGAEAREVFDAYFPSSKRAAKRASANKPANKTPKKAASAKSSTKKKQ